MNDEVLGTVCVVCAKRATEVECVIEERLYGDRFVALITGRVFRHVHRDGTESTCRENIPNWVFTMAGMDKIDRLRKLAAGLSAKFGGDTRVLRVL